MNRLTSGRFRPHNVVRSDRGSSIISFLLLLPILIGFIEITVLGGRYAAATADVRSAAREAARQASVAAGPNSAAEAINPAVDVALRDKGFQCQSPSVVLGEATDFVAGGEIQVTVTCTVQLSDLDLLGAPGTIEISQSVYEPVDYYRAVEQ